MNKILKRMAWLVIAAPAVYLLLTWNKIPETVALHYNLAGEPDRLGSRSEGIWMIVILIVLNAGIYLLLTNIYRIDPKRNAKENREKMSRMAFGVIIFMSALVSVIIYYTSHPELKFKSHLVLTGVGLLFAFVGNYMYTIKPNYFAGLRLPWTLENEENWRRTHLLGGKLWFIGGLTIAILSFLLPDTAAFIVTMSITAVIVIVPAIFSYRFYKKQKALNS